MNELTSGQRGRVLNLETNGELRRRLLDLGLVPGTDIERILASPGGDPVCYRVRGAMIALRSHDANQVVVSV
jgi:ferrous iron transport protein A